MQRELESILRPAGVSPQWVMFSNLVGTYPNCRLISVKFLGRCAFRPWDSPSKAAGWLGRTLSTDGELYPFIEVHCDRTLALIRPGISPVQVPPGAVLFGRALARVLAHELYHLLANTKSHGKSAITSSKIGLDDLLYGHLVFEEQDLRRMFPALRAP